MTLQRSAITFITLVVIFLAGVSCPTILNADEAPRPPRSLRDEAAARTAMIVGRWRPSQDSGEEALVYRADGTGTNIDGSRFLWAFEGRNLRARPESSPDEKENLITIRFSEDANTFQLSLQWGALHPEFDRLDDHNKPLGHRDPAGGKYADEPVVIPELPAAATARESADRLAVHVDATDVPPLRAWADEAAKTMEDAYPKMLTALGMVAPEPVLDVNLVIKRGPLPGALTENKTTTIFSPWIDKHEEDQKGVGVHELTHVLQRYGSGSPQWLVEGIADYVRYFVVQPGTIPAFEPREYAYDNGYITSAALLDWVERTKGPGIVARLNIALHDGTYSDELFAKLAGCEPKEAWRRYVAFRVGQSGDGEAK